MAVTTRVEPSALYRACREAVQIANQPAGFRNLNRCSEWGSPRVPVLVPTGGDTDDDGATKSLAPNPRPSWSAETLQSIKDGKLKRVMFWTPGELGSSVQQQPKPKRRRKNQDDLMKGKLSAGGGPGTK